MLCFLLVMFWAATGFVMPFVAVQCSIFWRIQRATHKPGEALCVVQRCTHDPNSLASDNEDIASQS